MPKIDPYELLTSDEINEDSDEDEFFDEDYE